jgi:hypothetical protein
VTSADGVGAERKSELAGRLSAVRARIAAACHAAGRASDEVTLIAVTKTRPVSDIRLLCELGVPDIGENKDQEAAPKAAEAAALGLDLTWHFVGQLQTNKAASVARYASYVHSVDRPRLVHALGNGARRAGRGQPGRALRCLIEISLDGDPDRGGAMAADVPALAQAVKDEAGLMLSGVMAVAPLGADPAEAFGSLVETAALVRDVEPGATMVSAGMSSDVAAAVAAGATHVRIGTALLGDRGPIVM